MIWQLARSASRARFTNERNDPMKRLSIASLFLALCPHAVPMTARVTFYTAQEVGGSLTSTGRKPIEGRTCAVDPRLIPYGSSVFIPALAPVMGGCYVFHAEDTGRDVKSRKASKRWGRNDIVIDVFVSSKKKALHLARTVPMFTEIQVDAARRKRK